MSPIFGKRQYIPQVTRGGRVLRDLRFDNARGILIILVVIGHFLMPLYQTRFITGIYYAIYIFHMPCFIFITGYYAKTLYKNGYFRWGRVVELLWLYILFKFVVNITEGMLNGHIPLLPDFFHESGAPWYLLVSALYYLLVPLIRNITGTGRKLAVVAGLIIVVSFGKYFVQLSDLLSFDRFFAFLPFFCAGYFVSEPEVQKYLLWKGKRVVETAAVILLLLAFLLTYDVWMKWHLVVFGADYNRYPDSMQSYLWFVSFVWYTAAFVISVGFIGAMLTRRMAVITRLGRNTLQIYFLHRPIRDILEYLGVFGFVNPHSKINVIFYIICVACLAVLLGNSALSVLFGKLRTLPDPLLEKLGGL